MPRGREPLDITGLRFGRLVAVRPTERRQSRCVVWEFKCDCGKTCFKGVNNVRSGNSVGCGCVRRFVAGMAQRTHGQGHSKAWHIWAQMKQRCTNPGNRCYKWYGARGITICKRWLNSFENFWKDMGDPPAGLSLDRIDNDGPYSPDNCRWATAKQQYANSRQRSTAERSATMKAAWARRKARDLETQGARDPHK